MNPGDVAWVSTATALVMLMTPALGFFYGGLVRRKNLVSTIAQCFASLAIVSLLWALYGYSLAFGQSTSGLIGNLSLAGLLNVNVTSISIYAPKIPELLYFAYQMMFAVIAPALIIGAFAERVKFRSLLIFIVLWSTFIYSPVAHWTWNVDGWIRKLGAIDFAGGIVIHITAGLSALAAAIVFGRRKDIDKTETKPSNVPYIILGAALLWFGWFGFNGGSALEANEIAVSAIVVSNLSAAGILSNLVSSWRAHTKLDDTLDVFACHGVSGIWGSIATGLFASLTVNPNGANGLFYGNPNLLGVQLIAVVVVGTFAFIGSFILLKLINAFSKIRVSPEEEEKGLDQSQCGEEAYCFD